MNNSGTDGYVRDPFGSCAECQGIYHGRRLLPT